MASGRCRRSAGSGGAVRRARGGDVGFPNWGIRRRPAAFLSTGPNSSSPVRDAFHVATGIRAIGDPSVHPRPVRRG